MQRADSFSRFFNTRSIIMDEREFASVDASCSPQQAARRLWEPTLPAALRNLTKAQPEAQQPVAPPDAKTLSQLFPKTWGQPVVQLNPMPDSAAAASAHQPLRVGVVLSGGQAAGGHNVIAGVFDYIKQINPQSQLIGFLNGPHGIFTHNYREISEDYMARYRNMGGFDMICSGRHKIETEEHKQKSLEICAKLDLHGLVIIGGDDSNTNGAILAEYFKANACNTKVIGVPKTIDGDLKNKFIETSFGFDTAVKVYSELIGNLCTDAATSMDRYHFVRLMGRSASNIALECAMQTRANLTFIGEEVGANNRSLKSLIDEVCNMVQKRDAMGKHYGVILLPEGLMEFVPEFGVLIEEINEILAADVFDKTKLTEPSRRLFESLPEDTAGELLLERDSHGNVQVAKIAMEKLMMRMTQAELKSRGFSGRFIPTGHYFGYEGRCAMPSNFDANYCYALGHTAGALIDNGLTGYMATVRNLGRAADQWTPGGCPITIMMNMERRKGKDVPVIKKYLVELDKPLYCGFARVIEEWKYQDLYRNPGPIQFDGPTADIPNYTIVPPSKDDLLPTLPEGLHARFSKSLEVMSPLQCQRLRHRVPVAAILRNPRARATVAKRVPHSDAQQDRFICRAYPLQCDLHSMRAYAIESIADGSRRVVSDMNIGVVLVGQAVPGVMNVVHGLFERLAIVGGKLWGFTGITGLLNGDCILIDRDEMSLYINQGGFEMLGRTPGDRAELRTESGLTRVASVCHQHKLTALVIIGGKFSLTDAAVLTEYFLSAGVETRVVGVPANSENNVRHPLLEAAIGFDSTSKSYSSLIGNLLTDAASATKYWYFVRLMGNVTSHIVLEAGLQTHPNAVVISEKYVEENGNLSDVVLDIAKVVAKRAKEGKNFGTVLIPEGLLTCIPQTKLLLGEIDSLWAAAKSNPVEQDHIRQAIRENDLAQLKSLTPWSAALLKTLPQFFREQLTKQTPTGRLEVSELGIEQLLANWVQRELQIRKDAGDYNGFFSPVCHYVGFQGRSTMPSNFDCALGTAHGYLASILIESDLTGFATSVRGLCGKPAEWRFTAVPLVALCKVMPDVEERMFGRRVPIIPGYEVDLNGSAYKALTAGQEEWETADNFCNPGPIQFSGVNTSHYYRTLFEEQYEYMAMLEQLDALTGYVGGICSFGVNKDTLKTAVLSLQALADIISDNTGTGSTASRKKATA